MPIEWFVTTASQSRIWLKLLSDDSNKVGICLLCRSTQLHATTSCRSQFATTCDSSYVLQSSTPYWKSTTLYYKVLQSTNPVLLCTTKYYSSTTKYYSSTTLYYTVLLQYYSVLHSATPVLLYYKVLQYYSVLQSTTPVLLQYYTVLLQYYSVLQSTPVLLCTTILVCATKYYSSTTLYYKVLLQYYSVLLQYWLIRVTYETLFTMRGAAEMSLQHRQILRLPRKVTLIIDPLHTWNVISNKRSNKSQPPTSANTAPATQNDSHDQPRHTWNAIYNARSNKCHCVQTHQILRLPRKMNLMIDPCHTWNAIYNARSNKCHCPNSPNTAPATKNESHD